MASKFKITSHKVIEEITVVKVNVLYGMKRIWFMAEMKSGKVTALVAHSMNYYKSTPDKTIKKHKELIKNHLEK